MVTFPALLQRMVHLLESPQPFFTESHAASALRCVGAFPSSLRSRNDTLNMFRLILCCPHASHILARYPSTTKKVASSFFTDLNLRDDPELHDLFCQVLEVLSVCKELPVMTMIIMVIRLNRGNYKTREAVKAASSFHRDCATTDRLLSRIMDRLPRDKIIRDSETISWPYLMKDIHKKMSMQVEKQEFYFLLKALKMAALTRTSDNHIMNTCKVQEGKGSFTSAHDKSREDGDNRGFSSDCVGDRANEERPVRRILPNHITLPVLQCIQSTPVFCSSDTPTSSLTEPRPEEWIMMIYLISNPDPQFNKIGKKLWRQRAHLFSPQSLKLEPGFLFSMLHNVIANMHGNEQLDAIERWLDILTAPELLAAARKVQLRALFGELAVYEHHRGVHHEGVNMNDGKVVVAARRVLQALEVSENVKDESDLVLSSRLECTNFFSFLQTPEEVKQTMSLLKNSLTSTKKEHSFIRPASDFLRFISRYPNIPFLDVLDTSHLLVKAIRKNIEIAPTTLNRRLISSIGMITVSAAGFLRFIPSHNQPAEAEAVEGLRKELCHLVDDLVRHPTATHENIISFALLQLMDTIGLASDEKYTTAAREVALNALRSVPNEAQGITPFMGHHCLDVLIRSISFHVADKEVLSVGYEALKRFSSPAVLQTMAMEHRRRFVERGVALYSALVPFLSTQKEARRVAKQILLISAGIAAEKTSRTDEYSNVSLGGPTWITPARSANVLRYRCAVFMWSLAVCAAAAPVPRTPIDRYLTPMLRFAQQYWVASALEGNDVDEVFSLGIMVGLLPKLRHLVSLSHLQRAVFLANVRRNKSIISTACEVLWRNRTSLSPVVWYRVQSILCELSLSLQNQCTPQQSRVLQLALEHTLRNVQACNNCGTWHMLPGEERKTGNEKESHGVILRPRELGLMFVCASLISDISLRAYLIQLVMEQLAGLDNLTNLRSAEKGTLSVEEKSQAIFFNLLLTALRRGEVLYY